MALAPRSKSSYARSRVCGSSSASPGAAASAGPGFGISGAWGCSSSSGAHVFFDNEAMGGVLRSDGGWVPLLGAGSCGWKGRGRKWGGLLRL